MRTMRESYLRQARDLADELLRCAEEAYTAALRTEPDAGTLAAVYIVAVEWHNNEPMTLLLDIRGSAKPIGLSDA